MAKAKTKRKVRQARRSGLIIGALAAAGLYLLMRRTSDSVPPLLDPIPGEELIDIEVLESTLNTNAMPRAYVATKRKPQPITSLYI
jgi:hypothetical protein